jgi:hypothetical protein
LKAKSSYELRVFIPLFIITIFCFSILMMHPFKKTASLSSAAPQTKSKSGALLKVGNLKANTAQPIKTSTNYNDPLFTPPNSLTTISPATTASPQPAASPNVTSGPPSTTSNSNSGNASNQSAENTNNSLNNAMDLVNGLDAPIKVVVNSPSPGKKLEN